MLNIYLLNALLVTVAVLAHYEMLRGLSVLNNQLKIQHRLRILVSVYGALIAHVMEIWMFGAAYYFMVRSDDLGGLQGNFDGSFMDCVYFSFTSYTSLGYGDIEPLGGLRFTAGLESLTGLVLIGWSASFLYVQMSRFWGKS